jgi:phage/plasmid-like protein (TIGR03299 family)
MKSGVNVIDRAVTAAEAAELAGMSFEVELWPMRAHPPEDAPKKTLDRFAEDGIDVSDRFAVVRTDTGLSLATVGTHYHTLNYGEAFDFMDTIEPRYVAAGVRRGGREGYMVVQAPEHLAVDLLDGEDKHDLYVVLRTSHDGSKKVEASVLPLRDKCTNMMSLRGFATGAPRAWGITHTSTMREKLAEAQRSLSNLDTYVDDLEKTAARLAAIDVELEQARRVLEWALPNRPKRDEQVSAILSLYESSPNNGYTGTGWGLVNATTEWLDWGRESRSADARFINGLAGYGHRTVNRVAGRLFSRAA